jgi:2-amino-4-hydroxy-6-hydroxymethyldihydropteridine diphosphokinase
MILIGLGANLASAEGGPQATLEAALAALGQAGVAILARSRWYRSAPVPRSDQPWFVNGVAAVGTRLAPAALLALLHQIEAAFGRERGETNAARTLDLDLLAYDDLVASGADGPILPHPRLHQRAFVLLPLAEIAPDWRHPVLGASLAALIAALPPGQDAKPLPR